MDTTVGHRIKTRRKELNITQTQIQEITSISSGNLSCIENGKYLPSAVALMELSKILNCSIDWLLTGENAICNTSLFSDNKESLLLNGFRQLDQDDQQELLDILEIKLRKRSASSSGVSRDAG